MEDKKIWSFFYQLSAHMWDDPGAPSRGWYLPPAYRENNACDPQLWDELTDFLHLYGFNQCVIDCGDGMKYESHPEICAPDAWDKDLLRDKLRKMRALGIEPIPKLNFSACHDAWLHEYARRISTPEYYRVCADLIREVCEAFDSPRLFHLGLDEENAQMQKNRSMCIVRSTELWWHDLYFLFDECRKNGVRPWVWADYCWGREEEYAARMPKDVLQSNGYYGVFKKHRPGTYSDTAQGAYEMLNAAGFEQILTCSTYELGFENSYQTLAFAKDRLDPALVKGFLTVPWVQYQTRDMDYVLKNDAYQLYLARRRVYPETL